MTPTQLVKAIDDILRHLAAMEKYMATLEKNKEDK